MVTTPYRAILNGNQITWLDLPPDLPCAMELQIFLPMNPVSDGTAMAQALTQLAQTNPFQDLDPVAWQQETRQDKPLM